MNRNPQENFEEMEYEVSTATKLSAILPRSGRRFRFEYEYDFGDGWRHEVLFEGCVRADPKAKYPLCLGGSGPAHRRTPTVTTNPGNQTVTAGQNVTFTAAANGNPTPTVQWQVSTDGGHSFTDINGATSTTLTLNNVTAAMNGNENGNEYQHYTDTKQRHYSILSDDNLRTLKTMLDAVAVGNAAS
jgi:hypothetical protein